MQDCLGNLKFSVAKRESRGDKTVLNALVQVRIQTFAWVILNRLLECGYVAEGTEEQNHFILLIPDRRNLHKKPHGCPWREHQKGGQLSAAFSEGLEDQTWAWTDTNINSLLNALVTSGVGESQSPLSWWNENLQSDHTATQWGLPYGHIIMSV